MFLQHRLRNHHFIFCSLYPRQQQLIPFLLSLLPPHRIPPQKCHWTCPRQVQCLLKLLLQKQQYNKPKYVAYKHHRRLHQRMTEISLDAYIYWWTLLWSNWKKSQLKKEDILRSRKYPHCKLLSQHITLRLNSLPKLQLFIPTNKFVLRKEKQQNIFKEPLQNYFNFLALQIIGLFLKQNLFLAFDTYFPFFNPVT